MIKEIVTVKAVRQENTSKKQQDLVLYLIHWMWGVMERKHSKLIPKILAYVSGQD